MAEPSLGYALGLNVKRQDIFAPAAKALSQNLANWNQEKAQAKREKEAKASKVMADMMKFDPSSLNRKVRLEATAEFEKSVKELENAIETDESEINMLAIIRQANNKLAKYRDQSENRNALEQQARTNPDSVPTVLRNYLASNVNDLTIDETELLPGFGITYDPNTKIITSFGFKPTDVRATLNSVKPTEEEMLAMAKPEQLQKSAEFIKMKTGYKSLAFINLTPDQQRYTLALTNVLDKDPGAIGSISEEVLRKEYGGDYNRYLEATRLKLNELKSNTKEGEDMPTPLDAQRAIGMDYMIKNHAPEWTQSSMKTKELPEVNKDSGSTKTPTVYNESTISEEYQFTPAGYKLAIDQGAKYGLSPEDIIKIYNGGETTAINQAQKNSLIAAINKYKGLNYAPTVAFQVQGAEKVRLSGESYNVNKLWYNKNDKSFYAIVDKQVPGSGTSMNLSKETLKIDKTMMKELAASTDKSIENGLAAWNNLASSKGLPTTDQYSDVAAPPPSGDPNKSSGKGISQEEFTRRGLNAKDYKFKDGKWFKK